MILDTNGLSAFAEGEPGLEPLLRRAAQVAIPVIVLGEYRYGISQSRNHIHYEQWLAEYLPSFRILDVDERTTFSYSAVRRELKKAVARQVTNPSALWDRPATTATTKRVAASRSVPRF